MMGQQTVGHTLEKGAGFGPLPTRPRKTRHTAPPALPATEGAALVICDNGSGLGAKRGHGWGASHRWTLSSPVGFGFFWVCGCSTL